MQMTRAYSMLDVKSIDNEKRIITGIATTPSPDRMGDIVDPMGVKFANPMPLLWQHKSAEPVGQVTFDKPTKNGISFKAQLPVVEEAGKLKDRIDEAWQSVKLGLVKAVSIGFRAIEFSFMKEGGGINYQKTEVLELSLVTIPAQADARIETIKSIDAPLLAASGIRNVRPVQDKAASAPAASGNGEDGSTPGVTGRTVKSQKDAKAMAKQTIAEQISGFEATRAAKAAAMLKIMDDAAEKNETLDDAESEAHDTLKDEVAKIDQHLVRLRSHEVMMKATAVPVVAKDIVSGSESRASIVVTAQRKLPPGIGFIRMMGARYLARVEQQHPADIAKAIFPDQPELEMVLRAPVAVGNTTNTTWAAPLVYAQNLASEFIDLLVPATLIGRIPGLTRVPFNIRVPLETTGASVNWVGEGQIKPVSAMAFDSVSLAFNKVAGIVPITQELMRFSTPAAEGLIRDSLVRAITYLTDRDFLDPSKAVSGTTSPASITNGVTPITATGTTAAALRSDLGTLLSLYTAANMSIASLVLVMTSTQAMRISLMRNALGQPEFPNLSAVGGSLEGIPVITTENMVATGGSPAAGYMIIAINAPEVLLADDGGVTIDASTEASIQMDSTPDSPATASTITVSAFQYNMVFIRAERFITWKKRRAGAVQFIQNAKYA